jgi:hypothetical protein
VRALGISEIKPGIIPPTSRETPVTNAQIHTCDYVEGLPDNLADELVDALFPMAQGVEEAGAVSYCLRYVIELARLTALKLALDQYSFEAVSQEKHVNTWRIRCGSQLQLVHMCVNLDVFRQPVSGVKLTTDTCRHFRPLTGPTYYTTLDCIVSISGVFYDPCRCVTCAGDSSMEVTVQYLQSNPLCRLRFDPRTIVQTKAPIGTWADGSFSMDFSDLLKDSFAGDMLSDPDAVGNTPDALNWWDAEGPMSTQGLDCDMIVDYWPDDWDYPIGYHVSSVCLASESAYRSFDQSFGLDESTNTLVFQADLLRDLRYADTHMGVCALCRSHNFGVPLHITNNVRYCTRSPLDDAQDYTITGLDDSSDYTDWACSSTPYDLPWPDVYDAFENGYESTLRSIGTVPNMPLQVRLHLFMLLRELTSLNRAKPITHTTSSVISTSQALGPASKRTLTRGGSSALTTTSTHAWTIRIVL